MRFLHTSEGPPCDFARTSDRPPGARLSRHTPAQTREKQRLSLGLGRLLRFRDRAVGRTAEGRGGRRADASHVRATDTTADARAPYGNYWEEARVGSRYYRGVVLIAEISAAHGRRGIREAV